MDTTFNNALPGVDLLALQQISRIVSRGEDAESRIQDILRYLAVSHRLVRGRVLVADQGAREIYIRYAHGLTPAEVERGRYRVGEGVSGRVFATGEAVLIADVHEDEGFLARVEDRGALPSGRIAFLCVPIVRDDVSIGVLAALCRSHEESSPQSDIALIEVIAGMIAPVLCVAGHSIPWVCPRTEVSRASCSTPVPVPVPSVPDRRDPGRASRDLTLRMAQQRHREGRLHLATGLYLKVVDEMGETEQVEIAVSKLMEIVRYHESKGNPRLAADVLGRLKRARDGAGAAADQRRDPWDSQRFGAGGWDYFGDSAGPGGIGSRVR